jgi:Zn-dependent protease
MRREPLGTVGVPLLSYLWAGWMMGWASAPYDPRWEDRNPKRAAAMAAAGPLANLALAAVAFAALKAGIAFGAWIPNPLHQGLDELVRAPETGAAQLEGVGRLCSILLGLNTLLFVFNLIPVPPLDGASVLAGVFAPARRFRDHLRASAGGSLVGLLIAWYALGWLFVPIFRWIVGRLYA